MDKIRNKIEDLESLQFELKKARFNYKPTDDIQRRFNNSISETIHLLTKKLTSILPKLLPPLQIHNPKPTLDITDQTDLSSFLEEIGLSDEEDEDLLIQLTGNNTDHRDLLNYLGIWYTYQRKPDHATGYFQEVLDYSSSDHVLYNLSYALAVQKILSPALEYLDQVSSDFDQSLVDLNKAVIYHRLGRYEEASSHFQSAIEHGNHHELILFNWASSILGFDKTDEAEIIFNKLKKLNASYPGLQYQLGQIHARKGNYPAAIMAFEQALSGDEDNLEILSDLGTACLIEGNYEDAIEYFQQYHKLNSSISVLNNLGAAYMKLNQYEHAVEVFKQALDINPGHNQSNRNLKVAESYLAS